MKISLKVSGNPFDQIRKAIDQIAKATLTELSQFQEANLKARTMAALGLLDAPMLPLSREYQRRKSHLGRRPIRDLRLTGAMMGDLKGYAAHQQGRTWLAQVRFRSERSATIAEYNQRRVKWFGISPEDLRVLQAVLARFGERLRLVLA